MTDAPPDPQPEKMLVLHIEVPGINVDDLTEQHIRDCGGDPNDPDDMILVVCTDSLSLAGVVVLNHDDVGGHAMTGHAMTIVGVEVRDRG